MSLKSQIHNQWQFTRLGAVIRKRASENSKALSVTVFLKPQYKDVYRRTIEMPQRARLLKINWYLKIHYAHQKLLSPISG